MIKKEFETKYAFPLFSILSYNTNTFIFFYIGVIYYLPSAFKLRLSCLVIYKMYQLWYKTKM